MKPIKKLNCELCPKCRIILESNSTKCRRCNTRITRKINYKRMKKILGWAIVVVFISTYIFTITRVMYLEHGYIAIFGVCAAIFAALLMTKAIIWITS